MNSFTYISADPGIPVPGKKGASVHVASVLKELARRGLHGRLLTARPKADALHGYTVSPLPTAARTDDPAERERRLFLLNHGDLPGSDGAAPDFVYERYSLWHYAGLAHARSLGVPFVLEVNSPLPLEAGRYRALAHAELADGVAALLLQEADGVVCVSSQVAQWAAELRGRSDGVWTIPNGFDEDLFRPTPDATRPSGGRPRVLFCGTFRPWHGLHDLLEAFRLLVEEHGVDAELRLVGDGPAREDLERRAADWGLRERLDITGQVPHDRVPHHAMGASVAVAPYPNIDGFYFSPLKVFEFMALGLPVVATRIGQIPELIRDGERGVLCEPGAPAELARALTGVLTDPDRAQALGRAGCEWAHEHASWRSRVADILTRIEQLR